MSAQCGFVQHTATNTMTPNYIYGLHLSGLHPYGNVYGWQSFLWWVQTVSGAPPTAFWGSVYLWDLINYAVSAAGNTVCLPKSPCQFGSAPDQSKIGSDSKFCIVNLIRRHMTNKGASKQSARDVTHSLASSFCHGVLS